MFCTHQHTSHVRGGCKGPAWRDGTHLDTADDGGGQRRVVLRAQQDGVHQDEAATQREQSRESGDEAGDTEGAEVYPMTQERTNCTANIGSRHPLYARPCSKHGRASAHKHTHTHTEEAYHVEVTGVVGVQRGRQNHNQGVVIEEPVFTQLLQGRRGGGINQD